MGIFFVPAGALSQSTITHTRCSLSTFPFAGVMVT
jgi:hypothetical protein